jgi:protein transport protein SEC24
MCTFPNDTPPEYFAPLDPTGARVDRMQRPELTMGTVEFTVPKEYWNKEPVGLQTLFLIDVSRESVHRGFLKGVCEGIKTALYGDGTAPAEGSEGDESSRQLPAGAKVGIVTYDKEVQFYNLTVCALYFQFALLYTNGMAGDSGPGTDDGYDRFGRAIRAFERRPFRGPI